MNKTPLIIFPCILLLLSACNKKEDAILSQPLKVSALTVGSPLKSQFRDFKGQVVAAELTPIAFKLIGEIKEILVKPNDKIEKGQLIAKLDNDKQKQALKDAEAQFKLASSQLNRGKELLKNSMITAAEFDKLLTNRLLAEIKLKTTQNHLSYTQLKAPFTGKVSEVLKKRFELVAPGEPVITLFKKDKVYVRIELTDNILFMVTPNSKAKIYKPEGKFSGDEKRYKLSYLEHSSEPNSQTQTYEMYLHMPQPKNEILPGTSVNVAVDMAKAGFNTIDGYFLPITALEAGNTPNEFYVWKIKENKVTKTPVTVFQIKGDGIIVSSGVSKGDLIVTTSLRKLREGMLVHVVESKE